MAAQLPEIARAMLNPQIYPDKPVKVDLMQTQMSFIFLTGKYVYKIKKPVNLGYLDYTTLEKRHFFCEQEIKLNRRLSPEMYLGVIAVTRSNTGIGLNGKGEIIDYAVKMLYLPQERMMNVLLDNDRVSPEMVERISQKLVDFHARAETSPAISAFGTLQAVKVNTDENFSQTEKYFGIAITPEQFLRIREFTYRICREKSQVFNQRVKNGRIKDCHGDLHAQHICFIDGISIFDCIEAVDRFRYCDVASEIAFLAMDLDHYGRADLSRRFTDSYIEFSKDPQIKELLKFYKCYRAYVRGKVNCFKYDDPYISEQERKQTQEEARSYFDLADAYSRARPRFFITVGLVGSGKTTLARAAAKRLGLTVISSDIARKQLASIPATEHRYEGMEKGIYSADFSRRTYEKLYSEAAAILSQGDPVIIDATFLKAEQRRKAQKIAEDADADFFILECTLDEVNTKQRLNNRVKNGTSNSDGHWEIYEPQKRTFEKVNEVPKNQHFVIDSSRPLNEQISQIILQI